MEDGGQVSIRVKYKANIVTWTVDAEEFRKIKVKGLRKILHRMAFSSPTPSGTLFDAPLTRSKR